MAYKNFLSRITESCIFQLESGNITHKKHYQGALILIGPRVSKKQLLEIFKGEFENISGLEDEFKKDDKYGGFPYKLDKSGNPILRVETKAGSEILLTYDKALEKYYHQDVYNLEKPKNFDPKKARSLKPKDRIKYLKETVPRNKVIEFQIANAKSLSTESLTTVPGFISARKEPGTLYINKETGQVHFVNARTNIWRTTVIKTRLGDLPKTNLFPLQSILGPSQRTFDYLILWM